MAPDYGFKERIEYEEKVNLWNKISGYISSNNTNMRINNAIKERKGQEELIRLIMASPHKDVLMKNPNILKWFIIEKMIKPRIKNDSCKRKTRYFKRDTQEDLLILFIVSLEFKTLLNKLISEILNARCIENWEEDQRQVLIILGMH